MVTVARVRKIVLCVDDNVEVLQALRRQLRLGLDDATRIEVATDVPLALARLEAIAPKPGEAVIIVSDWLMPGMKGEDLVKAVSTRWGPLGTIVLSGHITAEATRALEAMPQVAAILRKPWASDALLELVKSLLASATPPPPPAAAVPEETQ